MNNFTRNLAIGLSFIGGLNTIQGQSLAGDTKGVEFETEIPNTIDDYLTSAVDILTIGTTIEKVKRPTDLDFHPDANKQLWIVNKGTENSGGSTVIFSNAGEENQTDQYKKDGNAYHFMALPTGIAFSKNGNFATSSGIYDANHSGGANVPFTGPALWSGDLSIYAEPSGGNGSHLDMLHVSPYSQGIASEKDNVFWVFDGNSNDIVRYDFKDDHGPGNTDHDDGVIHRYSDFSVARDPNHKVVSHLVVSNGWVYVVDYGNQKVFRIKAGTGTKASGSPSYGPYEILAEYKHIIDYTWENVVTTGLVEPAGIDVIDDRMIVSDYATGEVIIYDISSMPATELTRISTDAEGIMGVKIGPEKRIWFVDYDANTVNKITSTQILGIEEYSLKDAVSIYPNPANNMVTINVKAAFTNELSIKITDITGKEILNDNMSSNSKQINTGNWTNGIYLIHLFDKDQSSTQKIVITH